MQLRLGLTFHHVFYAPYYVALFEMYHALGLWERARKARENIADGTLFPIQREWLEQKEKEMPKRIAGKL